MTFNQILDDYAKRGLLDGNLVARLSAAHKREVADALDTGAFVEAAHKREKATTEKSSAVGNAAKMREAVVKCYQLAYGWEFNEREGTAGVTEPDAAETLLDIQSITTAALAAPLRNCDVGTVKEQHDRFAMFCRQYKCCDGCPFEKVFGWRFSTIDWRICGLAWAQMPYEEGGEK